MRHILFLLIFHCRLVCPSCVKLIFVSVIKMIQYRVHFSNFTLYKKVNF